MRAYNYGLEANVILLRLFNEKYIYDSYYFLKITNF